MGREEACLELRVGRLDFCMGSGFTVWFRMRTRVFAAFISLALRLEDRVVTGIWGYTYIGGEHSLNFVQATAFKPLRSSPSYFVFIFILALMVLRTLFTLRNITVITRN